MHQAIVATQPVAVLPTWGTSAGKRIPAGATLN